MLPDAAAEALAEWQAALAEQRAVEKLAVEASTSGPPAKLAQLLAQADGLAKRADLLLAEAVRVQRANENPWRQTDPLTSTRMGLPEH